MYKRRKKVSLLFNANKTFDRGIMRGIGEYIKKTQCPWDVFIEEDFRYSIKSIEDIKADGVIADFDDPLLSSHIFDDTINVVGVGGSYSNAENYPNIHYVASDNYQLVYDAYTHLKNKGIDDFAFYGVECNEKKLWAKEREHSFRKIVTSEGHDANIYIGNDFTADNWLYSLNRLADWIQILPKPIGIIAVTDSRARHILQVCEHLNLLVPDQVLIIGIDNEEMAQYLSSISLSTVEQGTFRIGYEAAKTLDMLMSGSKLKMSRTLISPYCVHSRQSTDYKSVKDPYVMQSVNFIRLNACKGIKVDQVVNKIGISRSNLESRFKCELGYSVHHLIHQTKLSKACDFVCESDLSFYEISELCGYPSIQYMYTLFKKELNMTPKEYRNHHKL